MRRSVLAACLLATVLARPTDGAVLVQDGPSTITEVASLVRRATEAAEPTRTSLIQDALAALDGDRNLVGYAWIREPLAVTPPDLERATARLASAQAALARPQGPAAEPRAAHAALVRILESAPFKGPDWYSLVPPWLIPAVDLIGAALSVIWDVVRWPLERVLAFIGTLVGGALRGPVAVLLAGLFVAGLALLYWRGLRSALVSQAELAIPADALPPTAHQALSAARGQAIAGNFRDACHFLVLSTLLSLQERGHGRFDPTATNREHLRQVAPWPSLAEALGPVVARFDRLWYGSPAVTEDDYRDLAALVDGVGRAAT